MDNETQFDAPLPAPTWQVTFADLLTLLLAFFVLRCSMLSFAQPVTAQPQTPSVSSTLEIDGKNSGITGIPLLLNPDAAEETVFPIEVFTPGGDEINFGAIPQIQSFGERVKNRDGLIKISVFSADQHAKCEPDQRCFASNWELSARRAELVARQLIDAGVDPTSISAIGHVLTGPVTQVRNERNEHRNQRVEITITPRHNEEFVENDFRGEKHSEM